MIYRILRRVSRRIRRSKSPAAPASVGSAGESEAFELPEPPELPDLEVDAELLDRWVDEGHRFILIDIREPYEIRQGHLEGAWLIPMNQVPERMGSLPRDRSIVLYCAAGVRSFDVSYYLREQGIQDVWSLDGGVAAWAHRGYVHPADSDLGLTLKASLTKEALSERGLESCSGTIQSIQKGSGELTFSLAVFEEGRMERIDGLLRSELGSGGTGS
jgi:rhodanese-related sulfurtransferase